MRPCRWKRYQQPLAAVSLAHQDPAPGKGGVIYPAFYHPESSINRHLCSHNTMINEGHNYDPNSQQVTKVSSESPKNDIR